MENCVAGFDVLAKIKEGSLGTIWCVAGPGGSLLAVKQLSAEKGADPAQRKRFRKEFDLQKGLDHKSILRVFDFVEKPPQDAFTMEYFESEGLKTALYCLPDRVNHREFKILRQIADALSHVHEKGVVHKDLKPENVLIDAGGTIRLIDFSLAQARWDRWLQFGKRMEGTPMYMAPEQARGGRCDARTDAYAFGLIMYELLGKRMPFSERNPEAFLRAHQTQPPPPLTELVPGLAPDLNQMVLGLLDKDPGKRPVMKDVVVALTRWEVADPAMRRKQVRMFDAPRSLPDPFNDSRHAKS
ncbi:MAG TPA: serine/threonine-protein kinase [Planctomycetota bacterium]